MRLPALRLGRSTPASSTATLGIDPASGRPKPNAMTIAIVAAGLAGAAAIYQLAGGPIRDETATLQAELTTQQAVADGLITRLAEARDAARDDRITLLTVNAHALDQMVPPAAVANDIEAFEIQLPDLLAAHGLEANELARAPQLSDDAGGRYLPIRVVLSGPRNGLFTWLDTLHDLDRLVTVHNLQFSLARTDPTQVNAQLQLRLWFTDTPTLGIVEKQVAGAIPTDDNPDGTDGMDEVDDPDGSFTPEPDPTL